MNSFYESCPPNRKHLTTSAYFKFPINHFVCLILIAAVEMTGRSSPAANPPAAISTSNQQATTASQSSDGACSAVTEAQQLTTEGNQGIITTLHCLTTHQENTAKINNLFPTNK